MKIKLIPGWRKLRHALSVQIPALNLAMLYAWSLLPGELKAVIPVSWLIGAAAVLIVLGVAGRMIDQQLGRPTPGVQE